jgi:glycolate oxidase FAD binding subunit
LNFGGQVMKNVAGYDVARLMAGRWARSGCCSKSRSRCCRSRMAEATLRLALPQDQAIEAMNRWGGQPLPISATCWEEGVLTLRLSGAGAAVAAACDIIGGERFDDADAFWHGVREQQSAFFAGRRAALAPVAAVDGSAALDLPGAPLIEWGGAQRWLKSDAPAATRCAKRRRGPAAMPRCSAAVTNLPAPSSRCRRR